MTWKCLLYYWADMVANDLAPNKHEAFSIKPFILTHQWPQFPLLILPNISFYNHSTSYVQKRPRCLKPIGFIVMGGFMFSEGKHSQRVFPNVLAIIFLVQWVAEPWSFLPPYWHYPETFFTKGLRAHFPDLVKIKFAITWRIMIWSGKNFVHVMAAGLPWPVQNFGLSNHQNHHLNI